MATKKNLCYKCEYLDIRFNDKKFKYGCKKLGFKSATINWGWLIHPCPLFKENPKHKKNSHKNVSSPKNLESKIDYII